MSTAVFTKTAGVVTVVQDGVTISEFPQKFRLDIDENNNTFFRVDTDVSRRFFGLTGLSEVTFDGVAPTNRDELQTAIDAMFFKHPETSGGAALTRNNLTKTLASTIAVSQTNAQVVSLSFTTALTPANSDTKIILFAQMAPTASGNLTYPFYFDFDAGAGSPLGIGPTLDTGGVSSRIMFEIMIGAGRILIKSTVNKVTGINNAVVPSMFSGAFIGPALKNPIVIRCDTSASYALSDIRCYVQYDKY